MHQFTKTSSHHSATSLFRTTMQVLVIGVSSLVALSGCQATKSMFGRVEDGSLAYKNAEKLEPMQLPAETKTAPFIPLYPTPEVGSNTLDLENDSGNRYKLPKPYRQVPTNNE